MNIYVRLKEIERNGNAKGARLSTNCGRKWKPNTARSRSNPNPFTVKDKRVVHMTGTTVPWDLTHQKGHSKEETPPDLKGVQHWIPVVGKKKVASPKKHNYGSSLKKG
jgi:hypothetical protein